MQTRLAALFATALSALLIAPASAETETDARATTTLADSDATGYAFGMRIGGWGFRQAQADRRTSWDDCRMDGLGAFGERRIGKHGFVEAGLDLYFSDNFPLPAPGVQNMERVSGLVTAAGGLRMYPTARVSPYVQLGVGVELTKVAVHQADHTNQGNFVLPSGFLGVGGDIRLGKKLRIGANIRANIMGHFPHEHSFELKDEGHDAGDATAELEAEPEIAAQAQFYLRYEL